MANKYLVNSADLTSVANAIRTKGETSKQLVFPADFVAAIENLKGGLELNFEVVGGTAQPANPAPNTIWVNTEQEITGWVLSPYNPSDPAEGMMWVQTGDTGSVEFNTFKENELSVYIYSAAQYISGSWINKYIEVYVNDAWADVEKLPFFTSGRGLETEHIDVYHQDTSGDNYFGYNATYMRFVITSAAYVGCLVTFPPVDLTNIDTLYIDLTPATNLFNFGVADEQHTGGNFITYTSIPASTTRKTVSLDVSSLTGKGYVRVNASTYNASGTSYVYNVWGEYS